MRVDIAKKNISDHDIDGSFVVGTAERSYEIVVKAKDGSLAAQTSYGRRIHEPKMEGLNLGTGSMVIGSLPPRQELKQMLFLNLIYDVSRPGKYTVQVTQTDREKNVVVKTNIVTLAVTRERTD